MKSKCLSALCALLISAAVLAIANDNVAATLLDKLSSLLTVESFEGQQFPPADWRKFTEFGGSGWAQGADGATVVGMEFFGPASAAPLGGQMFAYASWATGDADTNFTTDQRTSQFLVTPLLESVQVGDSLRFSARTFSVFDDSLDIMVSRTNADSLQSFDTTLVSISFNGNSGTDWKEYAVDLSGFAGTDIYLAFREHVSGTFVQGDALLLDLVEVTSLVTSVRERRQGPSGFALAQNYPNPFNPTTQIQFTIPEPAAVTLKVYNVTGQEVARLADAAPYPAGSHALQFNAASLPNGVYYYKVEAGRFADVRRMTLLK